MATDEANVAHLRDQLETRLLEKIPGLIINGDRTSRLAGNLHISIPGIPNHAIIARVRHQLAISTGAACASGVETPSHVLTALGLPSELIEGSLRIGLGKFTSESDIITAAELLSNAVVEIRNRVA